MMRMTLLCNTKNKWKETMVSSAVSSYILLKYYDYHHSTQHCKRNTSNKSKG